jgi:hypothetical protein
MRVDRDARMWPSQELGKPGFAHLDRQPAQVLTVELQQIEGAEHGRERRRPRPGQVEHREPAVVANDGLAVDQVGARRQRRDRRHDQGKALAEIVAVAAVEPHASGVAPVQDAKAVVLDLVQPAGAGRRGFGRGRQAGFDEADRGRYAVT